MPSVDHCINKPTEMTTLTNSLEVFDTYKHREREDKDSDEESFHLPLDDDESETKYQDAVKNGNETEDDILDKFESTTAVLEPIDSQLEDRLLNDEEEDKNIKENGLVEVKSEADQVDSVECGDIEEHKPEDQIVDAVVQEMEDDCTKEDASIKDEACEEEDACIKEVCVEDVSVKEVCVEEDTSAKEVCVEEDASVKEVCVEEDACVKEEEDVVCMQEEEEEKNSAETEDHTEQEKQETKHSATEETDALTDNDDEMIDQSKTTSKDNDESTSVDQSKTTAADNDESTIVDETFKDEPEKSGEEIGEDVTTKSDEIVNSDPIGEKEDVPNVDLDTNVDNSAIDSINVDKDAPETADVDKSENECAPDKATGKSNNDDLLSEIDAVMKTMDDGEQEPTINQEDGGEKALSNDCEMKEIQPEKEEENKMDKCENSNDSAKNQNEDSEDLFDISIIRDAAEDNAENAYDQEHAEDGHDEDYDDRNDDKMDDDSNDDKAATLEEEEEIIEEHEDQLKNDDVDIEETNLKLDCDGKDTVSDGESDNRIDLVSSDKDQVQDTNDNSKSVKSAVAECRLDEVTGNLIGADGLHTSFSVDVEDGVEKSMDVDSEDLEKRKSLKRAISEEGEGGVAKKSRTEPATDDENKEVEKPKEKLPLRTLLSLSEFMRGKKNKRLTMHDLEEFCLQKICEVIVHKSDLGDVHHQLKLQEQLIESMRKEIHQLTKQARDLEIVNKKLMNDLKQQNATQKPLNPLKITRSVGLQVKFTPAFDPNVKRRQSNSTVATQKVQVQTPNRAPRNIPNATTPVLNRQKIFRLQATSPQKQQQSVQKSTPLLSQALQNRRLVVNDANNKSQPQTVRAKAPDPKPGAPSASVIDLTDEDDKKDKNKSVPPKVITQKNIGVPLRTTPVRVNATQGIRLATSQGKGSPITSVVTSSAPQVMYVVQSSSQNGGSLGPKAVVVNFQSANGVLTSALNGSAVSVIPKQSNTIQLKTVTPAKALPNNKILKIPSKHPAPLPSPPVIRVNLDKPLKPIPPKPHLTIRKTDTGIILQWKMPYELDMYEVIASYQLYAYQETSALPSTDMWRKVGDVKALALPMACTLTQFADKNKYYFAVRPVDIHKRIGLFSDPEEISL